MLKIYKGLTGAPYEMGVWSDDYTIRKALASRRSDGWRVILSGGRVIHGLSFETAYGILEVLK